MATAPFVIDPELQGIAIAYKNPEYIADQVLPRMRVSTKEFEYNVYPTAEMFTVPETLVGRKGIPNEVEFTGTRTPSAVRDYGLDDFVPNDDITQAAAGGGGYNPLGRAAEGVSELIALDRERRAAALLFTLANWQSDRRTTLSGTGQWSDYTNSNPINAIMNALDVPIMRPNVWAVGQAAWTVIRQHPKVVSAVLGNAGTSGTVTRQQLAELLEIEEIVVGRSYLNSAAPGQTASISRVWGKHSAFLYRNKMADSERGVTFGFTAQFGDRIAGQMQEPKRGLRGGVTVRVGESVKELIVSPESGYFFENCVA